MRNSKILDYFPGYEIGNPKFKHEYIDNSKNKFFEFKDEIKKERDRGIAHRYEKIDDNYISNVNMEVVKKHIEYIKKLLNNINLIANNQTYGFNNNYLSDANCEDIFDLLKFGSINSIFNEFGISSRLKDAGQDKFYYYQIRKQQKEEEDKKLSGDF